VTVLTSLDQADLAAIGIERPLAEQVRRLGLMAREAGADGAVAAASEIALLRQACGPGFRLVAPGIRPAGSAADDQKRVMTPAAALALGADFLVIGRPITAAADPAAAARAIAAEIAGEPAAAQP
jgi:orotidine-5'-phosphate decarboxylase